MSKFNPKIELPLALLVLIGFAVAGYLHGGHPWTF